MKRLYLVRHAKSDWDFDFLNDIDRPLNERGYRDAYRMAQRMVKKKELPGKLVSSPATRALSTAFIFLREFSFPAESLIVCEKLYEASAGEILSVIQELDNSTNSVMLFGHNPGFTHSLEFLTGAGIENIPTTGIACIDLDIRSWKQAERGKLVFFDYPKNET